MSPGASYRRYKLRGHCGISREGRRIRKRGEKRRKIRVGEDARIYSRVREMTVLSRCGVLTISSRFTMESFVGLSEEREQSSVAIFVARLIRDSEGAIIPRK